MTTNLMTIDVEDWFHILGTSQGAPDPSDWDTLPARVVDNTKRLMDILESRAGAPFSPWVGSPESTPGLSKRSPSGDLNWPATEMYTPWYTPTTQALRKDVQRAKESLEDASGVQVNGCQAAGFTITAETPWAFDILKEEGFTFDASVFPGHHAHGGSRSIVALS